MRSYIVETFDLVTNEVIGSSPVYPLWAKALACKGRLLRKYRASGDDYLDVRIVVREIAVPNQVAV